MKRIGSLIGLVLLSLLTLGTAVGSEGNVQVGADESANAAQGLITSVKGDYKSNGAWLGLYWISPAQSTQAVFDMLSKLQVRGVKYVFLNLGRLNSSGNLERELNPELDFLNQVGSFLDNVSAWEAAQPDGAKYRFSVFGWFNADPRAQDLSLAAVRTAVAAAAVHMVSLSSDPSPPTMRSFDGVLFDYEPTGIDPRFTNLLQLMIKVREEYTIAGKETSKAIGVAAHRITETAGDPQNEWRWTEQQYYSMATTVDLIAAMTYSTGATSTCDYKSTINSNSTRILKAVSGKYWSNDASHPAPTNALWGKPKVFIGLAGMPPGEPPMGSSTPNHIPCFENVHSGAPGLDAAITALKNAGDPSLSYFAGAHLYVTKDGSTCADQDSDPGNFCASVLVPGDPCYYSTWKRDWWYFGRDWLGISVPGEVTGLRVASPAPGTTRLSWSAAPGAEKYSITRGPLSALTNMQYGSCLAQGITGLSYDDAAVPMSGAGFAYLLQAHATMCGWGTLGSDSAGQPRVNSDSGACPSDSGACPSDPGACP